MLSKLWSNNKRKLIDLYCYKNGNCKAEIYPSFPYQENYKASSFSSPSCLLNVYSWGRYLNKQAGFCSTPLYSMFIWKISL